MKYLLRNILLLSLSTVLVNCDEDEVTNRNYPRLKTLPITEITSEGAKFHAEIISQGNSEIINYGFVWGENENPNKEQSDRAIYLDNIEIDKFSKKIESTLKEGTIYNVRAFVETNDFVVYGTNVNFTSLGSKAPEVNSNKTFTGTIGDTIVISGSNFSFIENQNKVLFNDLESEVVFATDSTLSLIVPIGLKDKESEISVSIFGNKSAGQAKFNLTTPSITQFSPYEGTDSSEVKIIGEDFTHITHLNQVKIGNKKAEVTSATKTQLTIIVPAGIFTKENELSITVADQKVIASNSFTIKAPNISDFEPKQASIRELVSIEGANFSTLQNGNEVYFDTVRASIVEMSATSLLVEVPYGVPVNSRIRVSTAEQEDSTLENFQIQLPELQIVNPEKATVNKEITLTGNNFSPLEGDNEVLFNGVLANILNNSKTSLLVSVPQGIDQRLIEVIVNTGGHNTSPISFEYVGGNWDQGSTFPDVHRFAPAYFQIGDEFYMGLGKNNTTMRSDFWKFNASTNTWTQLNDFPGQSRTFASSFVINNKGYIGLGATTAAERTFLKDFWEYDPTSDSWTQIEDFPGEPRLRATSFVDNDLGIVGLGHSREGQSGIWIPINYKDLYSYDPNTNSWASLPDFPGQERFSPSQFAIGSKVYVGLGAMGSYFGGSADLLTDFWEYDLESNIWSRLSDIPFSSRLFTASFTSYNRGYITLGVNYSGSQIRRQNSIYEYNPLVDEWTESEFNPFGSGDFPITFVYGNRAYINFIQRRNENPSRIFEIFEPYE